ncbi:cAMP-binding domain of CRP or a regulatory subunit of cAMP-dependent protein kinases [Salegentibacter echinorum]|uniref:cAMP-binding domain of CRP or a regulatory subunit of cAMP-dependent protein kinases n=1 Tax=Salegentibacter echinorum TaxID=1073325 RepID=A0A1M5CL21_SALEC|nr:Crp/Fnr family transcriptional regulator [Salegentibacter echinorum]SHF55122.1 cAMP-binding domain of CRP or a regulatory subunit of cAMP-dependent protein kinases [Salegentibacter echinorum]
MYQQILDHLAAVISLTREEEQEFTGILSEKRLAKKEFLIKPGQSVNSEYYVVSGCMEAYYLSEAGDKHIIQFALEDWWISDFEAFFGSKEAQLYVEAVENSILLGIDRDNLETLYERIPKFERFFRIKTTNAFVALRSRILSSLQKNSKLRYMEFCENHPELERRIPNAHIANYLGIKPESLSRLRKELS